VSSSQFAKRIAQSVGVPLTDVHALPSRADAAALITPELEQLRRVIEVVVTETDSNG
jgi:hypothetical protein